MPAQATVATAYELHLGRRDDSDVLRVSRVRNPMRQMVKEEILSFAEQARIQS